MVKKKQKNRKIKFANIIYITLLGGINKMINNYNWTVEEFSKGQEIRYRVVDKTTLKVLDDAQGYGYKTEIKARKCFVWKLYHSV